MNKDEYEEKCEQLLNDDEKTYKKLKCNSTPIAVVIDNYVQGEPLISSYVPY